MSHEPEALNDAEFEALATFRLELRRFLAFAESNARKEGLTGQQHQALLAVRADPSGRPTVRTVADSLLIKQHSASELVQRLSERGLVETERDPDDRRRQRIRLTQKAHQALHRLSSRHRLEIEKMQPTLTSLLRRLARSAPTRD